MAGNNSPWQGDKKGGGASVEADQEKPTFSGDDMEFESFMFNDGELSSTTQATAVATASPPASATFDPVPPQPVEQPAMGEETIFAEAGQSPDIPALSFEASGPVDTAPVDPADMILPSAPETAPGGIAGEDVPLP